MKTHYKVALQCAAILALLAINTSSYAQRHIFYQEANTFEVGPRIGLTTSKVRVDEGEPEIKLSYMAGVFGRYQITPRIAIQGEIDYAPRGGSLKNGDDIAFTFVDVPILGVYNVRYKMGGNPYTFDVFAGFQPSFLVTATENGVDNIVNYKSVGYDLVFGGGLPFGRVLFYATTKIGLGNLNESTLIVPLYDPIKSFVVEWTVGYRIGGDNEFKKH